VSIAAWAHGDPYHVIFAAGNIGSLARAFGRLHRHPIPSNLIFLLQDSENSTQEAASLLTATILANEHDADDWLAHGKNSSKHPGIIWMAPEGEDRDYPM